VATEDIRERLARLPRRAVVAFAARCARRVQPVTHVLPQLDRDVIDRAIAVAEAFANGDAVVAGAARAAEDALYGAAKAGTEAGDWAAAWAARAAAWAAKAAAGDAGAAAGAAAGDAAWAAAWAARAAVKPTDLDAWYGSTAERLEEAAFDASVSGEAAAWAAAASDLERLIALKRGEPDTPGAPIDPSESGPLGPLWPQGMPEWYTEAATGTVTPHEEPSGDAD